MMASIVTRGGIESSQCNATFALLDGTRDEPCITVSSPHRASVSRLIDADRATARQNLHPVRHTPPLIAEAGHMRCLGQPSRFTGPGVVGSSGPASDGELSSAGCTATSDGGSAKINQP